MSQALITRDDAKLTVSFTEAAIQLKSAALEEAALIGKVEDATSQELAVSAQKKLSDIINLVEKARKAAKEPILDFGRHIDDQAKRFIADAKEEQVRIAALIGDFQQLEQARVRAAEQARLAEQRRLEMERRAEEDRVRREAELEKQRIAAEQARIEREREIERKRLADEAARAARAAADAKTAEERKKAEVAQLEAEKQQKITAARIEAERLEAERQKALAEAKSHEELDRINQRHNEEVAALPVAAPARAEGQRVREEWTIEVTDIWMLARAHPVCVKIEPRLSEIKSLLDAGIKVAGVSAKKQVKSGVSGGRPMAAIDV